MVPLQAIQIEVGYLNALIKKHMQTEGATKLCSKIEQQSYNMLQNRVQNHSQDLKGSLEIKFL